MIYRRYSCACCAHELNADQQDCPYCGSHNRQSPYGMWFFCIMTCLAVAIIFKVAQIYITDHREVPRQQSLFETLKSK